MTQIEQVRRHLESGKSITPATALAVYGIFRLAVAIDHLRSRGMKIDTVIKEDEVGKKYAEYRLHKEPVAFDKVQVKPGHGWGLPKWVRKSAVAEVYGYGKFPDVLTVRFSRGNKTALIDMNVKELVRVG